MTEFKCNFNFRLYFRELAISYQNREDLAHTPSIGGSEMANMDEDNNDDQNQLLKIVRYYK